MLADVEVRDVGHRLPDDVGGGVPVGFVHLPFEQQAKIDRAAVAGELHGAELGADFTP